MSKIEGYLDHIFSGKLTEYYKCYVWYFLVSLVFLSVKIAHTGIQDDVRVEQLRSGGNLRVTLNHF